MVRFYAYETPSDICFAFRIILSTERDIIMQASRFNYLFLVGGKKYIFNAISEAIVSLPVNAALDEANNSAILSRYKMQVESSEHDSINLQQKINAISKAFGNVADLNVIITDKCNLQCPSCFNSQSMHRGENFLQLLDVLKHKLTFLCNLYDCGKVKKVSISISGGEPLLFRDRVSSVVKICESILDQRAHDYLIMTNGTLLTHDVICQLNDIGIKDFYISIDANRYSLLEHNNVCRVQTSFQNLCASAKLIYSVTGKKPILRINVSSIDDTFPIDAISELYKYGLSTSVILDFKRWYNNAEPGNYYDFLPNRIQELIQNAHNRGFECLWRWYDRPIRRYK